jgi:putative heme-binding domain-containing protein
VRVHALRACERWLEKRPPLIERVFELARDEHAEVRLQAALTLGELRDDRAVAALAAVALDPSGDAWLHQAVLTSVAGRGDRLLAELLSTQDSTTLLLRVPSLLESLATAIAARRDPVELSSTLTRIASVRNAELQRVCLSGLLHGFENVSDRLPLDAAAIGALRALAASHDEDLRRTSRSLIVAIELETDDERRARMALARGALEDVQATVERRLEAVSELAVDRTASGTQALVEAFAGATPRVREAILNALFAHQDRLPGILSAIESHALPAAALGAAQRRALLEHDDASLRERARQLLDARRGPEETFSRFAAALQVPGDVARGDKVFREKCGVCHRAHGIGAEVGPDLTAESQRSPATILRDILAPNDAISAGYASYVVETVHGQTVVGVLAEETANSLTLRLADGKERFILRKDVERLEATPLSLMPENLADSLTAQDVSDVIAWLSHPAESSDLAAPARPDSDRSKVERTLVHGESRYPVDNLVRLTGKVTVLDAHTLRYEDGTEVDLNGSIDAIDLEQMAFLGDRLYPAGKEAAEFLNRLIGENDVTCYIHTDREDWVDQLKFRQGKAFVDETSLNNELVRNGWAMAHHSGMAAWEAIAREKKRGLWRGAFVFPELWRKGERLPVEK